MDVIRPAGLGMMMALVSGPKWARRLLVAEGLLMLVLSIWLTSVCLQKEGFGVIAFVAALRAAFAFVPFALFNGGGIALGWLAMRLTKIPTDGGGIQDWYVRARRAGPSRLRFAVKPREKHIP